MILHQITPEDILLDFLRERYGPRYEYRRVDKGIQFRHIRDNAPWQTVEDKPFLYLPRLAKRWQKDGRARSAKTY